MPKIYRMIQRLATQRNTILTLGYLYISVWVLRTIDEPLNALSQGITKLDLHFGYDLSLVNMLFSAYGERGRTIYGWDLLIDTIFPALFSLAVMLVLFLAFQSRSWRIALIIAPLTFFVVDVIENVFLFSMILAYPNISEDLVTISSFSTQLKLTAVAVTSVEFLIALLVLSFRREQSLAAYGDKNGPN